jgi:hypothetical protein
MPLDELDFAMPQPLRNRKIVPVNFRPGAILLEPELAAHIGAISNAWNDIEGHLGLFLATLLDADPKTMVAMYLAITNDGAKRAAFDVVCKAKLIPTQRVELQIILDHVGKRYADRNKVVHGAWGTSKKYPNKLLWADIRDAALFHTEMMALVKADDNDAQHSRILEYQKTIMIYDERDFARIENQLAQVGIALYEFMKPFLDRAFGTSVLRRPQPPKTPPRGKPAKPDPTVC